MPLFFFHVEHYVEYKDKTHPELIQVTMHPAIKLRQLQKEERTIIGLLIKHGQMKTTELMKASGHKAGQAEFSRMLASLEDSGLIQKSGRQAPWVITDEAKRFVLPPQHREPVMFDDARVIGHGREFLTWEQKKRIEQSLSPSRIDASTFIRSLSERFIIDLSWASSNLEGNTYDYLDTEKLIRFGEEAPDKDLIETTMILNHKRAVEWMLDIAENGRDITTDDVCILHAYLMRGLLPASELGVVRNHDVKIGGSSYKPSGDHLMIRAGMVNAVNRMNETENPHEASVGILAGMSYLQAFSDGNKRTSRLLASIPLLRAGYAPLSFIGWEQREYTVGLVVYYETGDPSILTEGFVNNQIENSSAYNDLIRVHKMPSRLEITRRREISDAITDILSSGVSSEEAVNTHFPVQERGDAVTLIDEIMEGINEVNAVVWDVDPKLLVRGEAPEM